MLTSRAHPLVKLARSLQLPKARRENRLFLAEGRNAVEAALNAGWAVKTLLIASDFEDGAAQRWLERGEKVGADVHSVADDVLQSVAQSQTSPVIVALCELPRPTPLDWQTPDSLLIVLDGISDPGNVGTLVRASDAAGAGGILLTEGCADPFSPKAVRASAGSIFHLPLLQPLQGTPDSVSEALQTRDIPMVAAVAHQGHDCFGFAWPPQCALILGHETRGISPELESKSERVTIPLFGHAESLNVATAGAVLLFAWRQGQRRAS